MRTMRLRRGKLAIKALLIASATAISGAVTVPTLMMNRETSAPPLAITDAPSASIDEAVVGDAEPKGGGFPIELEQESSGDESRSRMIASDEPQGSDEEAAAAEEPSSALPNSALPNSALPNSADARTIAPKQRIAATGAMQASIPDAVRVFYATDRRLYSAKDPHIWITTIVPAVLVVLITALLVAGMFASRRRVWWGIGAFAGLGLSFLIVGAAIIKAGTLYRLASEDSLWFSSQRMTGPRDYPLNLGTSLVSIPPYHREGRVEEPSAIYFEFVEREDKHIMIQRIHALDPKSFFVELDERLAEDSEQSALIFVHGYNVAFDDALRRTAQLSVDLKFPGAPILYSWPSHGNIAWYRQDQDSADWSADHLQRFLADLKQRTQVKKIHLIAHSMGNRCLVSALELLGLRYPSQQPMLDQVVMAAPDVDAEEFQDRFAEKVDLCAQRATVYASSTDRALLASLRVNGFQRLGLAMSAQASIQGIDFVDVTPIDTSLLGHSYYGNHPLMIQELTSLFYHSIGPEKRRWLTQKDAMRTPPVWKFVPEAVGEQTVLRKAPLAR